MLDIQAGQLVRGERAADGQLNGDSGGVGGNIGSADRAGVVGVHVVGVGRSAQVAQQLNSKGELAFCVGLLGGDSQVRHNHEGDLVHVGVRKCGIFEGRFQFGSVPGVIISLVGIFSVGLDGGNGIAVLDSVHALAEDVNGLGSVDEVGIRYTIRTHRGCSGGDGNGCRLDDGDKVRDVFHTLFPNHAGLYVFAQLVVFNDERCTVSHLN